MLPSIDWIYLTWEWEEQSKSGPRTMLNIFFKKREFPHPNSKQEFIIPKGEHSSIFISKNIYATNRFAGLNKLYTMMFMKNDHVN